MEMAQASDVQLRLNFDALPWLPGAWQYASAWILPGGAHDNYKYYNGSVTYTKKLANWQETLLHDPQTSGGLLVAVPHGSLATFTSFCEDRGQAAWLIGDVVAGAGVEIV